MPPGFACLFFGFLTIAIAVLFSMRYECKQIADTQQQEVRRLKLALYSEDPSKKDCRHQPCVLHR